MIDTKIINQIKNFIKNKNNKDFYTFIYSLKIINKSLANKIFKLICDYTNCFKNSNTTSEILLICWKLINHWANNNKCILDKIQKNFNEVKLMKFILDKIKIYKKQKIIWGIIKNGLVKKFKINPNLIENILNEILITIKWIKLSFLILESKKNVFTIYLKSKDIF